MVHHDVEERVAPGVVAGAELFEGHVLVGFGRHPGVPGAGHDVAEGRRVPGQAYPQRHGVDEEADQIPQIGVRAVGDDRADDDVVLAAERAQRRDQRRRHHDRRGRAGPPGHRGHRRGGFLGEFHDDGAALRVVRRRPGAVQRELQPFAPP